VSALLVLTGTREIPGSDRATGAYASEVAESWAELVAAGHRVDLACLTAGPVPLEALDPADPAQRALLADGRMAALLAAAPPVTAVHPDEHDAVLLVGGHGAVWDLPADADLAALVVAVHRRGGVLGAVCHGTAGLLGARLPGGEPLVAGRRVAAFSDAEERAVGMAGSVPFLLSAELSRLGAVHDTGPPFLPHVVVDGRMVTGQNPASTRGVARAVAALAGTVGGGGSDGGPDTLPGHEDEVRHRYHPSHHPGGATWQSPTPS
jgi:putative intracellular protease/amidase